MNILIAHAEEALRGGVKRGFIGADLYVGDGFDGNRYALDGVCAADFERNGDDVEREVIDLLEPRDAQRGASAHHAIAHELAVGSLSLASAQDGHEVGRDLQVVAGE
jgi:hypothetical protein